MPEGTLKVIQLLENFSIQNSNGIQQPPKVIQRKTNPLVRDPFSKRINQQRREVSGTKKSSNSITRTNFFQGKMPLTSRHLSTQKKQRTLVENLLEEYGADIQKHLTTMEKTIDQSDFLSAHQISAEFRAKMVDWMAEVLQTFKGSDQTFFLAVNIMDRYFKAVGRNLKASDLHLTGIVSLFIASKYEDVVPILMKTLINKIGHGKFSLEMIQEREIEILKALQFRIGIPTVKEHLDRYLKETQPLYKADQSFTNLCYYIAKISSHNYKLSQCSPAVQAVSVLRLALKIQQKFQEISNYQRIMRTLIDFSQVSVTQVKNCSTELLDFLQNFQQIFPSYQNIRLQYAKTLTQYIEVEKQE